MDKELYQKLDEYYNKFNDVFPMMEYDLNPNDAKKFIDKCLKKNKKAKEIKPFHVWFGHLTYSDSLYGSVQLIQGVKKMITFLHFHSSTIML